jgi:SPP1 gp7 family putative phage head morphogenesis protein
MRQNLFRFSMAKDVAMLTEINQYLSGGNKVMRFEEFRDKSLKLNKRYNLNYLRAEYNTALQAGKHAADWEHYERMIDIYPNLEYRTQQDDKVRDEHAILHGIIAPIDSDFWAVHYPPNGWNCRCFVVQTAATPTDPKNIPQLSDKQLRPEFRINVGKTGQVFKETDINDGKPHPYFALVKDQPELKKAFELAKLTYAPHTIYKGKNGGKVQLNIFADRSELLSNYRTAKRIVDDFGEDVLIRPHLFVHGHKNPEVVISKIIGDITHRKGNVKNFANNSYTKLKEGEQLSHLKQTFLILDYGQVKSLSNREYKAVVGSIRKMKDFENLEFLIIVYNKKSIRIDKKELPNTFQDSWTYVYDKLIPMKNTDGSK